MEELYKKHLNPLVWKNNKMDLSIRKKLIKITADFIKEADLNVPVSDVILTGSLANYNYNKYSDYDVHVVLDFRKVDKNIDLVKDALNGKRFVWNIRHNIMLRGHEVEMYFQDKNDLHFATGIYSIAKDKWVIEPTYNPPNNVNTEFVEQKVYYISDTVDRMVNKLEETKDKKEIKLIHKKAKIIKDKIIKVRADALKRKGEFAEENLIFKKLRNEGYIEKIIKVINASYDKLFYEKKFISVINKFIKESL
jgi:predicted nucleotidyltransferase